MNMTTRERFLKCMRFEPVDQPPNYELGYWNETAERWINEGMPLDKRRALEGDGPSDDNVKTHPSWVKSALYGHAYFGIEERHALPIRLDPFPPFKTVTLEETDRYILFKDEWGRLRRGLKGKESMDTYVDFPVKTEKDFEALKERFDPNSPERYPKNWPEVVAYYKNNRDAPLCLLPNGAVGLYFWARQLMGTMNLSKAFFTKPQLAHKIMDFIADFITETTHKALHEVPVDYFNFSEDFAYKAGPHISPRIFKEFMLPRYKRITDFLKKHGVNIIWLDSDGNTEVLLPLLIEAGITCIWPLEVAAGMDPIKIRREWGHDFVLSGGIDKREISKGKKAIENELKRKIPQLVADGGYIPTLDHSFSSDISYENFLHYIKVKQQVMRNADFK